MTPTAPTWGDVEHFLAADGWRQVKGGERGGRRSRHLFYEKTLDGGRVLQTHISHSRQKTPSPGRFSAVLRHQLEVSRGGAVLGVHPRAAPGRPSDRARGGAA